VKNNLTMFNSRVLVNTTLLVYDKLFILANSIFVGSLIIRYLGPEKYGEFSYLVIVVSISQVFVQLGLGNVVIKKLNQQEISDSIILGSALALRIISSSIGVICLLIFSLTLEVESRIYLTIMASKLIFDASEVINLFFQSKVKNIRIIFSNNIVIIFGAMFKLYFIYNHFPVISFVWLFLFESILMGILYFFSYYFSPYFLKWEFNFDVARQLLKESSPLLLTTIFIILLSRGSLLIIKHYLSTTQFAFYSTAQMISDSLNILPMVIYSVSLPNLQRMKNISSRLYHLNLIRLMSFSFYGAVFISLLFSSFSGYLINLLFGVNYNDSTVVLQVLVFNLIPVTIAIVQSLWFNIENKNHLLLYQTIIGGLLNFVLGVLLINGFGIVGGALSVILSQFVGLIVVNFLLAPKIFKLQLQAVLFPFKFLK
jgi:O-antigen/teichoic acid export membrane protein